MDFRRIPEEFQENSRDVQKSIIRDFFNNSPFRAPPFAISGPPFFRFRAPPFFSISISISDLQIFRISLEILLENDSISKSILSCKLKMTIFDGSNC